MSSEPTPPKVTRVGHDLVCPGCGWTCRGWEAMAAHVADHLRDEDRASRTGPDTVTATRS